MVRDELKVFVFFTKLIFTYLRYFESLLAPREEQKIKLIKMDP